MVTCETTTFAHHHRQSITSNQNSIHTANWPKTWWWWPNVWMYFVHLQPWWSFFLIPFCFRRIFSFYQFYCCWLRMWVANLYHRTSLLKMVRIRPEIKWPDLTHHRWSIHPHRNRHPHRRTIRMTYHHFYHHCPHHPIQNHRHHLLPIWWYLIRHWFRQH